MIDNLKNKKFEIVYLISLIVIIIGISIYFIDDLNCEERFIQKNKSLNECENNVKNYRNEMNYYKNKSDYYLTKLNNFKGGEIDKKVKISRLKNFLKHDKTDENEYKKDYVCVDYTQDLIKNSYDNNIFSSFVFLKFKNQTHMINLFKTYDGYVFVEPQNDKIMYNLSTGDNYCNKANISNCSYTVKRINNFS